MGGVTQDLEIVIASINFNVLTPHARTAEENLDCKELTMVLEKEL